MSRLDDLYREARHLLATDDDLFLDVFYTVENFVSYPAPEKMEFFDEMVNDPNAPSCYRNADLSWFDPSHNYWTLWQYPDEIVSFDYPLDYYAEVYNDGVIFEDFVDACVDHNVEVIDKSSNAERFNSIIRAIRNEKKMMRESKNRTMRKPLRESKEQLINSFTDTALSHQDLYKPMSTFFRNLTNLENDIEEIDEVSYEELNNLHTAFSVAYDKLGDKLDAIEKSLLNKR